MQATPPDTGSKSGLRRRFLDARAALSPAERRERSARIADACHRLPGFEQAGIVCTYVNFRDEVETTDLIDGLLAAGRRIAVPVHLHGEFLPLTFAEIGSRAELFPNHFGIPQPRREAARFVHTAAISLFLVPGVAFDLSGRRLGYGLGFYDRAFAAAAPDAPRVGLAFEIQLLERLPDDPHDVPMDFVVTEDRVIPAAAGDGAPYKEVSCRPYRCPS